MPEADFPAPDHVLVDPGPEGPEPHDEVAGAIKNVSGQVLYLSEISRNVEPDASALVADVTSYEHQPAWEIVPKDAPEPAPRAVFPPVEKPTEPIPTDDASAKK